MCVCVCVCARERERDRERVQKVHEGNVEVIQLTPLTFTFTFYTCNAFPDQKFRFSLL